MVSKELYNISLCSMGEKPTSQSYFEKLLETTNLNWIEIYILPKKVSVDKHLCTFQYKILNNILFLIHFSSLKKFHNHCVPFATLQTKRHCISSILLILQSNYGTNFNIFFLKIFIFLKSLHRVPPLDSLLTTIKNRIFH